MKYVDLSSFVLKHFRKVFNAIINNKYFRIVVKGGRSSGKSFLIAMAIIIYVLTNKKSCRESQQVYGLTLRRNRNVKYYYYDFYKLYSDVYMRLYINIYDVWNNDKIKKYN